MSQDDALDRLHTRFGRSVEAGEVIFREGEPGTEAFLLEEGRIRLIKRIRGSDRSWMVLKPGDLFGESALLAGARGSGEQPTARASTAIALQSSRMLALDHTTLQNLLENHPLVASRIVQQLARRLRDAEDQIEILMLTDPQSKVVSALLKLAERTAPGPAGIVSFGLSPMELSSRVGLDVETVKRAVQKLREGQYVRVAEERVEVPDLEALQRLYGLLGLKDDLRGQA